MCLSVTAIIVLLHRITGIILFIFMGGGLWLLSLSLSSAEHFEQIGHWFSHWLIKGCLWAALSVFIFHLVSGLRQFMLDWGWGIQWHQGRQSALIVYGITIMFSLIVGGILC